MLGEAVASMERCFLQGQHEGERAGPAGSPPSDAGLIAADFRCLVADHEKQEMRHRQEQRRAAAEPRERRVVELIEHHLSDDSWRTLVRQARLTAERGEKDFILLRFPSQLCSDGGRVVDVGPIGRRPCVARRQRSICAGSAI